MNLKIMKTIVRCLLIHNFFYKFLFNVQPSLGKVIVYILNNNNIADLIYYLGFQYPEDFPN